MGVLRAPFSFILSFWYSLLVSLTAFSLKLKKSNQKTVIKLRILIELSFFVLLRKEVIQPHLPIRLPCYDFTPVINPTFDAFLLAVRSAASGIANSHGVTGGVYKTRERIHRDILIRDY